MNYKKLKTLHGSESTSVQRTDDDGIVTFVPADPLNRDWQKYQDWLAAGNLPEDA